VSCGARSGFFLAEEETERDAEKYPLCFCSKLLPMFGLVVARTARYSVHRDPFNQ